MAQAATLYRFRLNVSDVDRAFYDSLDLRAAMHPSESAAYLLTRVLAYALSYESGLEFSEGLCAPDEPAIRILENGETRLWIDIGNPSAKRIHKASKAARAVRIYTYKDPENLKREVAGETIHKVDRIEIYALEAGFLESLAGSLKRDNAWDVIHNDGELVVTAAGETYMSRIERHHL
jgi:uncharacterized protein YaeQ